MTGVASITVSNADAGMRLDRWFKAHYPGIRHGALEKLLRTGQVRVGGGRVKANRRLEAGEIIRIPPVSAEASAPRKPRPIAPKREDAEYIRSLKIFEDDAILVLNKPYGLAVQGGTKTTRHIDGMLAALEKNGERPRLVHRLDRDTSGLLILAKTRKAAAKLGGAFQRHEVEKIYWALAAGSLRPREGTIDMPIAKRMVRIKDEDTERVIVAEGEDAKKAITDFMTLDDAGPEVSFLALRPQTGRTHQLRVHCAAAGAPVIGDYKYGGKRAHLDGVADALHLFCRTMSFPHPLTGRRMTIDAPLTGPMLDTWRFFSFDVEAVADWPEAMIAGKAKK